VPISEWLPEEHSAALRCDGDKDLDNRVGVGTAQPATVASAMSMKVFRTTALGHPGAEISSARDVDQKPGPARGTHSWGVEGGQFEFAKEIGARLELEQGMSVRGVA